MNRYLLFSPVLLVILLVVLVGCGDAATTSTSLSVTPTSSTITAGTAPVTFKATLTNMSGEVSWTLSPNLGTLSSTTGLEITYTPPATLPTPTVVTLTASLGNLTAKATLTINPATSFTVTGKVQNYSAGAASLEAITNDSDSLPPIKVGTGKIETDSSFSLTLPETLEDKNLTPTTSSPCPEVTQTPASFKSASLGSLSVVKNGLRIGDLWHVSSLDFFGGSRVTYVYVDRDVNITGTCREERDGDNFSYIYNTNFKKGWNLGLTTLGETSFSFTTPESVDLPWLFSPSTAEDTTPPTVVSVDPPAGAKGVKEDASIVITFSEKMARFATEDAFKRSANFPDSGMTYSWNAEDTVLTIQPNDLLEYAAGEDLSITAVIYTFSFSDRATDVAGNSLPPFNSSFSTLRVISSAIYGTAILDGYILSDGVVASDGQGAATGKIEDGRRMRSFFSFDLTGIPANIAADEARLIVYKEGIVGEEFYPSSSLTLDHMNYGDNLASDDYGIPSLGDLGIFDSATLPAEGYLSSDVTLALNDDLAKRAERSNRSQYRLRLFSEPTDQDPFGYVIFTTSEGANGRRPFLNVVYYIP